MNFELQECEKIIRKLNTSNFRALNSYIIENENVDPLEFILMNIEHERALDFHFDCILSHFFL